jgi:hypothetical protein
VLGPERRNRPMRIVMPEPEQGEVGDWEAEMMPMRRNGNV